jgi:hypothetical protein
MGRYFSMGRPGAFATGNTAHDVEQQRLCIQMQPSVSFEWMDVENLPNDETRDYLKITTNCKK